MHVQSTSIEAYREHRATGRVTSSQRKIINAMKPGRDYSLSELAAMTGIEKSSVSGRVNELKADGKLVESRKRACHVTGKTINAVKLADQ